MPATYDRPTKAQLRVHLADGESWEATPADLDKFGYVDRAQTYLRVTRHLQKLLADAGLLPSGDIVDAHLNPLRYLVELAVCHPDLLDHPEAVEYFTAQIPRIERVLAAAADNEATEQ